MQSQEWNARKARFRESEEDTVVDQRCLAQVSQLRSGARSASTSASISHLLLCIRLVDEVLALEEGAQVHELPRAERDNANRDDDREPLDTVVRALCNVSSSSTANSYSPFVSRMRISRFCRYCISSWISLTTFSSLRISTSSTDSDSWFASAL